MFVLQDGDTEHEPKTRWPWRLNLLSQAMPQSVSSSFSSIFTPHFDHGRKQRHMKDNRRTRVIKLWLRKRKRNLNPMTSQDGQIMLAVSLCSIREVAEGEYLVAWQAGDQSRIDDQGVPPATTRHCHGPPAWLPCMPRSSMRSSRRSSARAGGGGMRKIHTISDFNTYTRSALNLRVHRTKSALYPRVHRTISPRTSRVHRTKSVLYRRVHPYYIGFPGFLETTIQLQHQCTLPESCTNLVTDMHTGLC